MPVAVPIALAVAGAASSAVAAKKQSDATKKAAAMNAAAVGEGNAMNYQQWLESRGVAPGGKAVNTKMPRWATWNMPASPSGATPIKL